MAFATIVVAEGLSKSHHRRAARMGPRAVSSTRPIRALMETAGLEAIEISDVTEDFYATAQAWFDAFAARARELRPVLRSEFDDRQKGRKEMIAAVDEGLIRRLLVSASAPGP